MKQSTLLQKYHVPGPRYTSYPTVPYWDKEPISQDQWAEQVAATFFRKNTQEGISLYIHLPFCESLCTYCGCNTRITVNHQVEEPYIEALLKEWQLYVDLLGQPIIKEIHLGGGTPTFFSPANLDKLMKGILAYSKTAPKAEFAFEAHPANTSQSHLEVLYQWGFRRISLGIQDFDPCVQFAINRKQSYEQVESITNLARRIGYNSVNFDLIYGLPLQQASTMMDTIEQVNKLQPDRIAFYGYAHIPWMKPSQKAYENQLPQGPQRQHLYELGKGLLSASGYEEIGMDHFALPYDSLAKSAREKNLHRNFMGYTPNPSNLLIGLGASSISDAWTIFVQNFKKVEDYYKAIHTGKFPFFRGHALTEEDLILRKHILNIMCHFETTWYNPQEQTEAMYNGLEKLREMESDGLVKLHPMRLEVTEEGRTFVRNICMAFDARLQRAKPKTKLFSQTI